MPRTKNFKKFQDHEMKPVMKAKRTKKSAYLELAEYLITGKTKNKSTRTKKKDSELSIYRSFGGHLLNPPRSCSFRRRAEDGGIWTDIGCCLSNCRERCNRYLYYSKLKPAQKTEHLRRNKVKI